MSISWESFKSYDPDLCGVRFKFENLCRQLFIRENLSGNKQFKYSHANPNNPGLEAEPIYDEINKRWIGFQAKFFDGAVDYSQIRKSAEKTIKYYTGKVGNVDLVFLFSNKPITVTAHGYVETIKLLEASNIKVQLITDTTILDLVLNKYPDLGLFYFGNHSLSKDWFTQHTNHMLSELGERYNSDFNVETLFYNELSLFVHDQTAARYINNKKTTLLTEIKKLYQNRQNDKTYLKTLIKSVDNLSDVTANTLFSTLDWENKITTDVRNFILNLKDERKELETECQITLDSKIDKKEQNVSSSKIRNLEVRINEIDTLLQLPEMLKVTDREKDLLHGSVLMVYGKAGVGKSQLLAVKSKDLFEENRQALLLVAGIYLNDEPIQDQIMKNLRLNFSFEDLIDILEVLGEKNNCIIPIFIDAINETWNKKLWKTGLPQIIDKIKTKAMVRLIISYRSEYETAVLPNSISNDNSKENIVRMYHKGFENNSIDSVKEFMDHYNIPFTPLEYFSAEMSNPLFLTLYCETFNGEEVSLPVLYDRIIERANTNIYRALEVELRNKGYLDSIDLIRPLLNQIAIFFVMKGKRSITQQDLQKLSYWSEYDLTPAAFARLLVKEHILHDSVNDENITLFFFSFDQMADFLCARAIFQNHKTKLDLRKYLSNNILEIKDNKLNNHWNVDLFVNICVFYEDKYDEECINIIDALKNKDDQEYIFSRYIDSFQWRRSSNISKEKFYNLIKKYPCDCEIIWQTLIGNSIKVSHPLNADFLNELLLSYEINQRDYLWTVYINNLTLHETDRLIHLIKMYTNGKKLEARNEKQVELLLTLFGWLLTSSNRWLRDYASKAMIEILKEHFQLCELILKKFRKCNDPYVIQRLFGIVFGACCKRTGGNFQALAEYVYNTVFNQEKVYPDILLRDYARLIIERFLYENQDYSGIIDQKRIIPPYNSSPIPRIEDQHYLKKEYTGATFRLINSMRFEGMGMYGDFGRYIFQSALYHFDVDYKEMFNYAIHHIFNELGFTEDFFGEHDMHCGSYNRHDTVKTERIGKKYQWITMYNMLSRIADHCKMIDRWSYSKMNEITFKGAWEPCVRDFDPTLNKSFMSCDEAPIFETLVTHVRKGAEENRLADISSPKNQEEWLETQGIFFTDLINTLILTDKDGQRWIGLTKYCDTKQKELDNERLLVWSWLYAYFMTSEQAKEMSIYNEQGLSVISNETSSHHETYKVFNREFPWSPSCHEFNKSAWVDTIIRVEKFEKATSTKPTANFSLINKLIQKYGYDNPEVCFYESIPSDEQSETLITTDEIMLQFQNHKETTQHETEKEIGKILHATSDLLWEEQYDATKESSISCSYPCAKLIEDMDLQHLTADGFLYDKQGQLAAFDTALTQNVNCVVIRKDIIDSFLEKTGLKLVWLVDAEKEILSEDIRKIVWSNWEAVFIYEKDGITGKIRRIQQRND